MTDQLEVFSPFDGHKIKSIPMDDVSRLENYLAKAYALTREHQEIPRPKRMQIIERAADLVESQIDEFALQAAEEGGKPLMDSRVELVRAVQGMRESARALASLTGREIPMNLNAASSGRIAMTIREPIGVVASVSAFNHPFNLIVHQVVPAVAVGCPVIVKPATTTPLSCLNLLNCLYEAGLPEEWARPLVCDNAVAEKLVTDPRIAFFSFIGSAKVGWWLRSKLAPGVRCALEHGGAAPVLVEPDADIDSALPLLVKGGFYHAGQVCVSVQRVFVHEDIADRVADGMVKLAEKLVVGDPTDRNTEVGPLILEREVERVDEWVTQAAKSGKILTGGKKIGKTCYAPTVIMDPSDDADVSTKEIFGPVVNVYRYKDRLEAIKRANSLPYSFQASVFTRDLEIAMDSVRRLSAAAVMVNDHTAFRVDWMPFGGHGASGLGVGGILPTMEEMTEEKLVVIKSNIF